MRLLLPDEGTLALSRLLVRWLDWVARFSITWNGTLVFAREVRS